MLSSLILAMTLSKSASRVCPLCRLGTGFVLWHTNMAARHTLIFSIYTSPSHTTLIKTIILPTKEALCVKLNLQFKFQCGHCCLFKSTGTSDVGLLDSPSRSRKANRTEGSVSQVSVSSALCCLCAQLAAGDEEHMQNSYLWPA